MAEFSKFSVSIGVEMEGEGAKDLKSSLLADKDFLSALEKDLHSLMTTRVQDFAKKFQEGSL